jgi:large subunit ribosomal protein L3
MKYIIGTKIGMVQLFDKNVKQLADTVVHCEPNKILEVKTTYKHGQEAVKIGYGSIDAKKVNKAKAGIFKKAGSDTKRFIRSFKDVVGYKVGDEIKVDTFAKGEYIDVQGLTRGRGFTGAIAR